MVLNIKSNWDEITWNEYEQIEQIISADIPSDYKAVNLISILTNKSVDEIENLPIAQFQRLLPVLEFLKEQPKIHKHKFNYIVNGREYIFKGQLTDISTAQYIDYRNYMNDEEKDVVKLFSCFLIPKGHDYNDGYDVEQVKSDIGDMCWLDVRAATFFFRIQLAAYILILKSSLRKTMKKSKATKKDRKQVEESLNNMACCLLSSKFANIAIPNLMS